MCLSFTKEILVGRHAFRHCSRSTNLGNLLTSSRSAKSLVAGERLLEAAERPHLILNPELVVC